MKKMILLSALMLLATGFSARADSYNYRPYVGFDYIYNHTTAKGISPNYNALNLRLGSDYSPWFATELFAAQSDTDVRHPRSTKVKTSYRAYGLDLIAMLPLGCAKRFSLLATAGIGEYVFKQKIFPQKHFNEHGWGYRFGGGLKYSIDQHWQARLLVRHVNFDHVSGIDHALENTLGIEYHF